MTNLLELARAVEDALRGKLLIHCIVRTLPNMHGPTYLCFVDDGVRVKIEPHFGRGWQGVDCPSCLDRSDDVE